MKLFHQIFGVLLLIAFALTGQYMDRFHNHLVGVPDGTRMMFRSRHIYILLVGLLNLGLGAYLSRRRGRLRSGLQWLGSGLIVIASILFVAAFFHEPALTDLQTPLSGRAVYAVAWGTLLHLFSGLGRREGAAAD